MPPPPPCAPKWAAVGRLGRVVSVTAARTRSVRDGGARSAACLLACACVCLGLDVSAAVPSGVWSRCLCEGVCGFELGGCIDGSIRNDGEHQLTVNEPRSRTGACMHMPVTHVLASHFYIARTSHVGDYAKLRHKLVPVRSIVDQLLNESAVPASRLQLHVVIDTVGDMSTSDRAITSGASSIYVASEASYRNAKFHLLRRASRPGIPPNDLRWAAYIDQVLPQLHDDDCVFAIDFGDVRLTGDPRELCNSPLYKEAIFVGSDLCDAGRIKMWATGQVERANFSARATSMLHRELRNPSTPFPNCGVVGGRLGVLRPFLSAMAQAVEAHYAAAEHEGWKAHGVPIDMLIFAQLVIEWRASRRASIILGYPQGPTTMPMAGHLCLIHPSQPGLTGSCKVCPRLHCHANESTYLQCRLRHLRAMEARHAFSHKWRPLTASAASNYSLVRTP